MQRRLEALIFSHVTCRALYNNSEKHYNFHALVGGATRHTVIVRACLSALVEALVLKDGEESAGGKCNINITC